MKNVKNSATGIAIVKLDDKNNAIILEFVKPPVQSLEDKFNYIKAQAMLQCIKQNPNLRLSSD